MEFRKKTLKRSTLGGALAKRPVGGIILIEGWGGRTQIHFHIPYLITHEMPPTPNNFIEGVGAISLKMIRERAWQHTLNPKP